MKHESKQRNTPDNETAIDYLTYHKKSSVRLHLAKRMSYNLTLRSRVEFSFFNTDQQEEIEHGYLLYQDIIYSFPRFPLRLSGRFAIFETDSYDNRLYAYENDVLYAFSVPAYSGKGTRMYLLANYKFSRSFEAWARWSQFYYPDRETIGTGLEEIDGNRKSEVKVQVRVRF